MIPDTRKDPRAKVLSMTVRYKSATIDEFIEHHSHDVSRGGMFIKTPSPFPPGTLLKFEVRIADEQKVMQGVGRVVWKREASSAAVDSPSGMGVKFIKLDDDSKGIIDRLVGKRGSAEGAYDAGERISAQGGPSGPDAPTPAGGTPAVEKPIPMRKGTMIGLGAVKLPEAGAKPGGGGGAFFPDSGPVNQPAPEDRTVMRQAAELLRDALREAGGSMEEIGSAGSAPLAGTEAKAEPAPEPAAAPAPKPSEPPAAKAPEKKIEPAARSERPAAKPTASPSRSEPPRDSIPVSKPSGGSKSAVWMVLSVIVIGGGIFFVTQGNKPAEPAPEPAAPASITPPVEPAAVAPAAPTEAVSAVAPEPSAAPSAAPVPETPAEKAAREKAEAAALKAEAEAAKKAEADAKKAEADAKKAADLEAKKAAAEAKKAEADAKKAADAEAQKAARAAAAARASTVMRSTPPAPAEKPAAAAPAAPSAAAPAEKPAAAPPAEKPAPAPKAAAPKAPAASKPSESDNPY